jgi:outer membrane protein OmpA-like peptidoglycan-associated protein
MKKLALGLLVASVATSPIYLNGCMSNTAKGGAIGAVLGGAAGAAIGDKPGREKEAAAIGAVAGGLLGAYIGSRMDKQQQALEEVPGMRSVKVDKTEGNQGIESSMQIQFDVDDDSVKPSERAKLDQLASVLKQYPENKVVIEGHTDSSGDDQYNQDLSELRAMAIEEYLKAKNLGISALKSVGYGETRPVASNDTTDGKAQNRRVEVKISVDQERARELYETEQAQQ